MVVVIACTVLHLKALFCYRVHHMKETEASIERIEEINTDIQHIQLAVDESLMRIKPGQSLLARLPGDRWDPYLRERWWAVNVRAGQIIIERPMTESYHIGQLINVLGLIGQPYRFRRTLRNVLLVAYDTPPTPLLMTIPWLLGNKIQVTMVLLGSARDYNTAHLPAEVEIVHGMEEPDTMTWDNQVMTVGWADQVFVAVGDVDEGRQFGQLLRRFRDLRAEVPKQYMFGVFRPLLPCGTGACQACLLSTREGTVVGCTDGPAFDLTQIVLPGQSRK